jgi:DNA repair photolyase
VLAELARHQATAVYVSVTTLDAGLAGKLEPRASRPAARLRAIRELTDAGIPGRRHGRPVLPGLTDHECRPSSRPRRRRGDPRRLRHAAAAAQRERRLWPVARRPRPRQESPRLDRIKALRGGSLNVSEWGKRMKGEGIFADQVREAFRRLGG